MATCPECRRRYPDGDENCTVDGSSLVPDETFASVDRDLAPGEMVGEYRIIRTIGKGSFGVVYQAVHPVIGKAAAVKILKRQFCSNPQVVARFIAEARAVNQIRHRNIVDIFSFGVLRDGRQYYLMELLEGEPLDLFLQRRGPIPPAQALPIFDRIARALDAAHGAGIIHRDLKPANVFLAQEDDGSQYPKLLDFGVAKLVRTEEEEKHEVDLRTNTGAMLGTPRYMSPEQCRGEPLDHRTDVYSFGVMIHELLTGRRPFEAESILKVMNMHTMTPAPRMSEHNPALPPELDAAVLHILEKDPNNRPATAGEAYRELAGAARAAGIAVPASPALSEKPAVRSVARLADDGRSAPNGTGTFDAQTVANRPPRRLVMLTSLISVGLVAAVSALFLVSRLRTPNPVASASAGPPVATSTSIMRPLPSLPVEEPKNPFVHFTVQSVPADAEVFLDGRSIGKAPGPLEVARSDKPVTLQFKAPGFRSKSVDVTPMADGVVSVTLTATPGASGAQGRPKRAVDDLEF